MRWEKDEERWKLLLLHLLLLTAVDSPRFSFAECINDSSLRFGMCVIARNVFLFFSFFFLDVFPSFLPFGVQIVFALVCFYKEKNPLQGHYSYSHSPPILFSWNYVPVCVCLGPGSSSSSSLFLSPVFNGVQQVPACPLYRTTACAQHNNIRGCLTQQLTRLMKPIVRVNHFSISKIPGSI